MAKSLKKVCKDCGKEFFTMLWDAVLCWPCWQKNGFK